MIMVVDYGMGNVDSVCNMIKYLGYYCKKADRPDQLIESDKLVLPGVGYFGEAINMLKDSGLYKVLEKKVIQDKVPILGICLGMQLFTDYSEEGDCAGFGWIHGMTRKLISCKENDIRVPHMGWDYVTRTHDSALLKDVLYDYRFYFAHSYYVKCDMEEDCRAYTDYGIRFDSVIQHGNIYGTQFHPEKSHRFGMVVLKNFLEI